MSSRGQSAGIRRGGTTGAPPSLSTVSGVTLTALRAAKTRILMRREVIFAALTIAIVVAVRTQMSLRGYLVGDDFAVRYRAVERNWSIGYAFEPYNDHVSPIGYSLQWVLQAVFPGSHIALVICTGLLMAVTLAFLSGFMWLLTRRVVAMVLSSLIVGFSLFTFEVATWWTVSLYSMTYLAFTSVALWGVARVLQGRGGAATVLVGLLGALLSDSKGFLVLVLVFGVAAGVAATPEGPIGAIAAWRRFMWVWLCALATSGALVLWSLLATSGVQGEPTVGRALSMMWELWVVNIAPAVFGGPWWWYQVPTEAWSPVRVLPAPPVALGVACLAGMLAGIGFIAARRPAVARFLPYAILYSVAATALPVLARSGTNLSSPAYRYTYDVVVPVVILVTLALVPMWWCTMTRSSLPIVVTGGLAVSMAVSTVSPASAWAANGAEEYVGNAVAGFPSIATSQSLMPQGVPEDLVPGLLWQYANTNAVLSPQPGAPNFDSTARGRLLGFDAEGRVVDQDVEGPRSPDGPDPDCGWAVTDVPRTIPLDGGLIAWDFVARVAYFSATDTTLNLAVGGQIHSVPLPASDLDAVYFRVTGPGDEVLVSVGTPSVTVCVTEVRIGNRVESATGAPVPWPPGPIAP